MEAWTEKDYLILAVSNDECIHAADGLRVDGTPNPLIPGNFIFLERFVYKAIEHSKDFPRPLSESCEAIGCCAKLLSDGTLAVYVAEDILADTDVVSCELLSDQVTVHASLEASAAAILPKRGIKLLLESLDRIDRQ